MQAVVAIGLLAALLPFEPMHPVAHALGFEMSLLEVVALLLLSTAGFLLGLYPKGGFHRRPVPLAAWALLLLLAFMVSTLASAPPRVLPLKFSLRLTAGVVAFFLTSSALGPAARWGVVFTGFSVAGSVTAILAVVEALGPVAMASWLAPFREHPFEVGGQPRVTATFAYPNTTAGFLVLALPAALYFVSHERTRRGVRTLAGMAATGMFASILLTRSRGAVLGAVSAVLLQWLWLRRLRPDGSRFLFWPLLGFVALLVASSLSDPTFRLRVASEGDAAWYRAALSPETNSLSLEPGERRTMRVSVTNTGRMPWPSEKRDFFLSYRWFTADERGLVPLGIEGTKTWLDKSLAPDEQVDLYAHVRAPAHPGQYVLIWDMVHGHMTWFSDKTGIGAFVRVAVGPVGEGGLSELAELSELGDRIASLAWRPGRLELWGLALSLFREQPLTGVGPDNFRWLYGRAAGRSSWDTRAFSNSLYLEILATTGLFGAAAFALLVASTLRGLYRVRKGDATLAAATVTAALVGFLVHGVFDYLLALTPIYLAFWILLGVASAAIREERA